MGSLKIVCNVDQLKRNTTASSYDALAAQRCYEQRRHVCRPKGRLAYEPLRDGVVEQIASLLIGVFQFLDLRDRELNQFAEQKEREFCSEFWTERLHLYTITLDAASSISSANSLEKSEEARRKFRTLFNGSMSVIQDDLVDNAMNEFEDTLRSVEDGEMALSDLGIESYRLGRICYESLKGSRGNLFSSL